MNISKKVLFFHLIFLLIVGLGANCKKNENSFIELGEKIPKKIKKNGEKHLTFISASDYAEAYYLVFEGIKYEYAINKASKVVFIATSDPKFKTSDGLSVDSTLESSKPKGKVDLITERGWSYYLPLESGWNAAFVVGDHFTEGDPKNTDKICFFFKRK